MNTKLFTQYLLERGLIDREQMLEVIEVGRSMNAGVDDIAVAIGLLTPADVHSIRWEQLQRDQPFERIAISLGLLTPSQLNTLTNRQRSRKILASQILLARGYVDFDDLMLAEYEYKQESIARSHELETLMAGADYGQVARITVSVLDRIYVRMMGTSLRIQDATTERPIEAQERLWTQEFSAGRASHEISLQMHESSALMIAEVVLGAQRPRFDDLVEDSVSEFLNIVSGHVCGNLEHSGRVQAKPPRVTFGGELLNRHPDAIVLRCDSGDVRFCFAFSSQAEPAEPQARPPSAVAGL